MRPHGSIWNEFVRFGCHSHGLWFVSAQELGFPSPHVPLVAEDHSAKKPCRPLTIKNFLIRVLIIDLYFKWEINFHINELLNPNAALGKISIWIKCWIELDFKCNINLYNFELTFEFELIWIQIYHFIMFLILILIYQLYIPSINTKKIIKTILTLLTNLLGVPFKSTKLRRLSSSQVKPNLKHWWPANPPQMTRSVANALPNPSIQALNQQLIPQVTLKTRHLSSFALSLMWILNIWQFSWLVGQVAT